MTGISREKVVFARATETYCLAGHYDIMLAKELRITVAKAPLFAPDVEDFLGRNADIDFTSFFPRALNIKSSSVIELTDPPNSEDLPEGFDADVWKTALTYKSGGVINFKDNEVITDVPVERYDVLPSWASLAQLTGQGVLEKQIPVDGAKRILLFKGSTFTSVRVPAGGSLPNSKVDNQVIINEWQFRILRDPPLGYPPDVGFGGFPARFFLPKDVILSGFPRSVAVCLRLEEGAQAPPGVSVCVPLKKAAP